MSTDDADTSMVAQSDHAVKPFLTATARLASALPWSMSALSLVNMVRMMIQRAPGR